jgi:hypothetical protein
MTMSGRKSLLMVALVALVVTWGAMSLLPTATAAPGEETTRNDVVYACSCGPECACNTVKVEPGNCNCGKPLAWGHVVKVEGDVALVCACAEGCTCSIDKADPTKCGCGKVLRRVSLKGTGLYFCNCAGSCTCNHLSAKPGKCGCGMELKKSG